jgi:hypothetical protein
VRFLLVPRACGDWPAVIQVLVKLSHRGIWALHKLLMSQKKLQRSA